MKNFHEELAAHLADQATPKPHPERYDHGYVATSAATRLRERLEQSSATAATTKTLASIQANMNRRKADLEAINPQRMADIEESFFEKPRFPDNEPYGPVFHVSLRGFLFALSAGAVVAGIIGLIRECAA